MRRSQWPDMTDTFINVMWLKYNMSRELCTGLVVIVFSCDLAQVPYVLIMSLLRQNDVATSFWRHNYITSYVRWVIMTLFLRQNVVATSFWRDNDGMITLWAMCTLGGYCVLLWFDAGGLIPYPANVWRNNNVIIMSKRRCVVVSTQ